MIQELFSKGGIFMYPLFLCSIIALTIIIERCWTIYQKRDRIQTNFPSLEKMILAERFKEAALLIEDGQGAVSAVLSAGLKQRDKAKAEIEEIMALKAGEELFSLKKKVAYLGVIATISTMIGLLGTVSGLVKAFQAVADLEGRVSPRILAAGIWEALLTTVVGLIIAIPCWIFYHYFRSTLEKIAFQIEHYGGKLILLLKNRAPDKR